MIVARNPVEYGFDVVSADPVQYEKVELPRAVDLRRVAEWTGTSVDEIQALNPELRRWTTPVRYPNYEVKVPLGTADQARGAARRSHTGRLHGPQVVHGAPRRHAACRRAQVPRVARRSGGREQPVSTRARVHAGQELIIPRAPAVLLAARTDRAVPDAIASRDLSSEADAPAETPAPTHSVAQVTYRVKRGDTLSSIAQAFDTSVAKIKAWNRLHSNAITAGARLKILTSRAR